MFICRVRTSTRIFIYKLPFKDCLVAPPCLPHINYGNEEWKRTKQSSQVHNLLLQFDGQKVAVSFFKNGLLWSSFSLQTGSSLLGTTWIKMRMFSALKTSLQIHSLLSSMSSSLRKIFLLSQTHLFLQTTYITVSSTGRFSCGSSSFHWKFL